jgi:hypothetical protein
MTPHVKTGMKTVPPRSSLEINPPPKVAAHASRSAAVRSWIDPVVARAKKRRRVGGTSPTPLPFGLGPAPQTRSNSIHGVRQKGVSRTGDRSRPRLVTWWAHSGALSLNADRTREARFLGLYSQETDREARAALGSPLPVMGETMPPSTTGPDGQALRLTDDFAGLTAARGTLPG